MHTVYTIVERKYNVTNHSHGVHQCYVCGALTDSAEVSMESVREEHSRDGESSFEREKDFIRAICPNESEFWHLKTAKLLDTFLKDSLKKAPSAKLKEKVLAKIREIRKEFGTGIRVHIINKEFTRPTYASSSRDFNLLYKEVMYQLHESPSKNSKH